MHFFLTCSICCIMHLKIKKIVSLFQFFTNIIYKEDIPMANFPCHNFSPQPLTDQSGLKTSAGNHHVFGLTNSFPQLH